MKNKTFRLLGLSTVFASAVLVGLSSCKKDKDDNNGSSAAFAATINGNAFKPKAVVALSHGGYIDIMGGQTVPGDSLYVDLAIPDSVTLGSKLTFEDAYIEIATFTSSKLYATPADGSHGTVTFTTVDKTNKKIAGKFSGVVYEAFGANDSMVIKDGQFNTTYTTY
jgi:hypothetical protein